MSSSGDDTRSISRTATPGPEQQRRQSHTAQGGNNVKRKRINTSAAASNGRRRRTGETAIETEDAAAFGTDMYDPDQPMEVRRQIQQGYRSLLRDVNDRADEFLHPESMGLHDTYLRANELLKEVRQTTEAAIDSHLLVTTADLSYRKILRITREDLSVQGMDVDEFVSKCATYMSHGQGIQNDDAPELSSTQRQRRRRVTGGTAPGDERDTDDEEDDGNMLQWAHLGQYACLPFSRRPALPGFLVGPLSVEKRVRKVTQRTARFRPNDLVETRPEVLNVDDLAKKENDLTLLCRNILQRLKVVQKEVQRTVKDLIEPDMKEEETVRIMLAHGLRSTGGIDFMRFVVNPKSFGQTVENIFYVSFLIRDGRVKIAFDDNLLPSIEPVDLEEGDDPATVKGKHSSSKHQAIFSIDMETWKEIIEAFDIKTSLIEHRREPAEDAPGSRGWYS